MRRLSTNNTLYKQDVNDRISNLSRVKISVLNYCWVIAGFWRIVFLKNNVPSAICIKHNSLHQKLLCFDKTFIK